MKERVVRITMAHAQVQDGARPGVFTPVYTVQKIVGEVTLYYSGRTFRVGDVLSEAEAMTLTDSPRHEVTVIPAKS